ncbi:MAG: N-acetylmuramoyl-L-alanine amidase [Phycisphaerae bacterium]|nr:N-acetylmuramoyl-L-alanine amidase [Phycisphaerae bacterium]
MELPRRAARLLAALALFVGGGCAHLRPEPVPIPKHYLPSETFASRLGLRVQQQGPSFVTLTDHRNTITIFTGPAGRIYVNGEQYGPVDNAIFKEGKVYVLAAREGLLLRELRRLRPAPPPAPPPPKKTTRISGAVVVDAGHGGKDPGAPGKPVPEKVIVLDIAQRLSRELAARGADVTMTRSGDTFVELNERAAIADRTRADLFVSLHADAAQRRTASGATLYIARGANTESFRAARRIQSALTAAGIECRGIQQAGFRVLVGHSRPAILIECGFMTNPGDNERLNTPSHRAKLATAIADGITVHLGQ